MKLSITMAICTYNRPQLLKKTLASVLAQTRLPDQMIVVDDGNLPEFPLWEDFAEKEIDWVFIRKSKPGLTESRAAATKKAWGDIMFFTDDDLELAPDYIEQIMAVYESDPDEKIAGVGGRDENGPEITATMRVRHLWDRFFLNSSKQEGTILKSGFCAEFENTPYPIVEPVQVDVLAGLTMSFRRDVLIKYPFTPGYHDYALDEDKDITYRISRKHKLLSIPTARLYHSESQLMRPDARRLTYRFLKGRYIFFYNHVRTKRLDWIYFWWAVTGYSLLRVIVACLTMKKTAWGRVRGIGDFLKELKGGRIFDEIRKYSNIKL